MVGGPGLGQPGAPQDHEGADRLDPAVRRLDLCDAGEVPCGHASVGWFSVLRCHQYPPAARPLDAHDHDPQTSVAKAYQEYDGNGRMKPSSHYDRVVDLCEELMKFTLLTRRPISSTDTASARKTRRSRNSASNSSRSDHQRVFDNIRIPSDTEMRSAMP